MESHNTFMHVADIGWKASGLFRQVRSGSRAAVKLYKRVPSPCLDRILFELDGRPFYKT
jgi:hypothetical protein